MNTSKYLSTISFNTESYLKDILDSLLNNSIITFYYYIKHKAEDNEKKNHYHIFIVPNGKINTDSLYKQFEETDTIKGLPLRCLPFRVVSSFGDKYLYDLHDIDYLNSKCEVRKYHYKHTDFKTSNDEYFNELVNDIDLSKYKGMERFKRAVYSGMSWDSILVKGIVPIQHINHYKTLYDCLVQNRYKYDNVDEVIIDTFTGMVLDKDFNETARYTTINASAVPSVMNYYKKRKN